MSLAITPQQAAILAPLLSKLSESAPPGCFSTPQKRWSTPGLLSDSDDAGGGTSSFSDSRIYSPEDMLVRKGKNRKSTRDQSYLLVSGDRSRLGVLIVHVTWIFALAIKP